jgi:hypothetical protein
MGGKIMKDYKKFILQHIDAFECYFAETDSLIIVVLDQNLNVSAYNDCFKNLLQARKNLAGESIHTLLLPESQNLLPLSDFTDRQTIWLNFLSFDSSPLPLHCHIFKIENDKHLILGGNLMLTNEDILKKMTILTNEMTNMTRDLHRKNKALKEAHSKIKILGGFIPICMHCKEIRDDEGYWNALESYITEHSEAQFSHSVCPTCMIKYYSGLSDTD